MKKHITYYSLMYPIKQHPRSGDKMRTKDEIIEIYTIGHSNKDLAQITDLLMKYNIELLIDVRSYPYSKYVPQFNRETLLSALAGIQIAYWYAGDSLGGRPQDPSCYKCGQMPDGKANYLKLVDYQELAKRNWFKDHIRELVDKSIGRKTVIMCSEEDPIRCHRHHLIAKALSEMGITVWHIRGKGDLEMAKFDDIRGPLSKIDNYQKSDQTSLLDFA